MLRVSATNPVTATDCIGSPARPPRAVSAHRGDTQEISLSSWLDVSAPEQKQREELLQKLASAISSGTYQCEPEAVAEAMVTQALAVEELSV
jgi:anti-sigma28 factor (negative regulator of flagellin synthesis)